MRAMLSVQIDGRECVLVPPDKVMLIALAEKREKAMEDAREVGVQDPEGTMELATNWGLQFHEPLTDTIVPSLLGVWFEQFTEPN